MQSHYKGQLSKWTQHRTVPKVCSINFKGSATSFRGIHGYIILMATLKLKEFFKVILDLV
jgi:hypothetical protein